MYTFAMPKQKTAGTAGLYVELDQAVFDAFVAACKARGHTRKWVVETLVRQWLETNPVQPGDAAATKPRRQGK